MLSGVPPKADLAESSRHAALPSIPGEQRALRAAVINCDHSYAVHLDAGLRVTRTHPAVGSQLKTISFQEVRKLTPLPSWLASSTPAAPNGFAPATPLST
jgi:hypothetical protein